MIAKLSSIALLAALTTAATAQTTPATAPKTTPKTTATPTTHHAATTTTHPAATTAAPACSKLPELSPKIPALPPGTPCAKPLYTIVTEPSVKLQYVSPLEGPGLRETLGLEPTSFSLDYIDTKIGTGELAAPHKWYTIHYTGYLTDGTKFDSSLDRGEPISIAYGQHQVIPGWDTGFDGMRVGGKRRLFIPYQLAYGATAQRQIPAKSELVFDVELISQSDEKPQPKIAPAPGGSTTPAKPATTAPTDPAKPSTTPPPADTAKPETTPHPQSL
jgi:peptidylprolyl isomerase